MISFTVRMEFNETERDAVTETLRHLGPASRLEAGYINYIARFVDVEPATVPIYEQYQEEAALEHHRTTPHFQRYATGLYQIMRSREIDNLNSVE